MEALGSAICLQVEAEEKAAVSAKEGLSKKLRDAEQRAEMLQDQITELEMSLERQRAAADARCALRPEFRVFHCMQLAFGSKTVDRIQGE